MIEQLYETYYQELVNWCSTMTQDRMSAEEFVQEAFLRALLHTELLEHLKPEQQRAWLYRIVKNLYIDWTRHVSHIMIVQTG